MNTSPKPPIPTDLLRTFFQMVMVAKEQTQRVHQIDARIKEVGINWEIFELGLTPNWDEVIFRTFVHRDLPSPENSSEIWDAVLGNTDAPYPDPIPEWLQREFAEQNISDHIQGLDKDGSSLRIGGAQIFDLLGYDVGGTEPDGDWGCLVIDPSSN